MQALPVLRILPLATLVGQPSLNKGAEPTAPPEPELGSVTERLVQELDAARSQGVANDLVALLGAILLEVGVKESAARGLLGNLDQLLIAGDGSSLKTGANTACSLRHHRR